LPKQTQQTAPGSVLLTQFYVILFPAEFRSILVECDGSMNEGHQREEAVFEAALALLGEERAAYLERACGDDPKLRRQVEALLEAHQQTNGLLEQPLTPLRESLEALNAPLTEKPGDRIGRYKLLQQIGEGGCGMVYMAEQQEPVKRLVALKVVKAGMDTRQTLARFEAERQALALMEHRNIAKVLDAGATGTGRPFFVMELVRGVKITEYCDDPQNSLDTDQRLNLFIQVCQAIQHAHQKGIIHRDIKPSNILVTLQEDGTPTPKVIDFGIAKATTGQTLTGKTVFTAFEQFIGTPAYMSPEQAAMATTDVDTRSDIYSLGVLLYELLTGRTPFDSKRLLAAGLNEVRRIICEEQPLRPSTRLRTLGTDEQPAVAKRRQSEAPKLIHRLSGDLDWIVMKCLEKDRTRRYETANGLAMDIQRHLKNESIVACPPSRLYRLRKMVRRHRLAFAAAAMVAVSLGIAILELGIRITERATTAEREKRTQAEVARRETSLRQQAELEAQHARDAATEAKVALASSDFSQAIRLMTEHRGGDALAYLTRSLSLNPASEAAATAIAAWLTRHSWAVPVAGFQHSNSVSGARFSGDGHCVLTFGADGRARVWDAQTGRLLTDSPKHAGELTAAAFSPDGSRILTASDDKTARVWDARTGLPLTAPLRHGGKVDAAEFSPDGNLVVTASSDKTSQIWDSHSGHPVGEPLRHDGEVYSAEFSPDGKLVVTASDDGTAKIWDALSGNMLTEPLKHSSRVVSARFSPDGNRIVTACPEGTARVWIAKTGQPLTGPLRGTAGVWTAHFSPDGERLVTTSWGRLACLWSAESGKQLLSPLEHNELVELAEFDPKGRLILTGCRDGTVRLWDAQTAQPVGEPIIQGDTVVWAEFSPDGRSLLAAWRDGSVYLWDIRPGQPVARALKHEVGEVQLRFDPDGTGIKLVNQLLVAPAFAQISPGGKRVVTACADHRARVWNADTGEVVAESPKHGDDVSSAQFSPDGKLFVTASRDNTAAVCDAQTGRHVYAPLRHQGWVFSAQFSPDSQRILTASQDGTARIWNAQTGRPLSDALQHRCGVLVAKFSPDGTRVVTASWDGTARVWDAASGKPRTGPLRHNSWVWSAQFNAEGTRIVTASEDRMVRVWNADTGGEVLQPLKHGAAVYFAEFSPDGKQIVTASSHEARLWDVQTGYLLTEPLNHGDTVLSAHFSPDGTRIVTSSWDTTVRVWDAGTGQPLAEVLPHDGPAWLAQFSPGGQRILTASADGKARLWDIAPVAKPPAWLIRAAEAISGRTLNRSGVLEPVAFNRAEALNQVRHELFQANGEEDWLTWGRWLLGDRSQRALSPFSTITIPDRIESLLKQQTAAALDQAEQLAAVDDEQLQRIARAREALHASALDHGAGRLRSNGVVQARAGHWKSAIVDFSRLTELEPENSANYHCLAALLVQSGDEDAYRAHCARALARFGKSQDPVTAERVAKDCLILPPAGDVTAIAQLADTAIVLGKDHTYWAYFELAKGLAEYRQGRFTNAVEWMQKVLTAGGAPERQAEAQFILAMAQYHLNQPDQALPGLSAGIEIVEKQLPHLESGDLGAGWIDWIIAHALMREAKSLIEDLPDRQHAAK
jgi:WD40 repeat protein/serine/threonine protein kinase/tetratricopeptide (TPR) repeat protein